MLPVCTECKSPIRPPYITGNFCSESCRDKWLDRLQPVERVRSPKKVARFG